MKLPVPEKVGNSATLVPKCFHSALTVTIRLKTPEFCD